MLHFGSVKRGLCPTLLACSVIAWSGAAHAQLGTGGQDRQGDETEQSAQEQPEVELLDAGNGEKRKLRYELEQGETETGSLRLAISTKREVGGQEQGGQTLPAIILPYESKVLEGDGEGRTNVEVVFQGFSLEEVEGMDPQMMTMLKQFLNGLEGTKATYAVSPRGTTTDIEIEPASGVTPQVTQILAPIATLLQATTVRFPEEAVGTNAKWRLDTDANIPDIDADASLTVTVKSLDEEKAKLGIETSISADEQQVQGFKLLNLEETGGGESTIAFGDVVPRKASTKTERTALLEAPNRQGEVQKQKNISVQELTITPQSDTGGQSPGGSDGR